MSKLKTETKPIIGLVPRIVIDRTRLKELELAIARFSKVQVQIPYEWLVERAEIQLRMKTY